MLLIYIPKYFGLSNKLIELLINNKQELKIIRMKKIKIVVLYFFITAAISSCVKDNAFLDVSNTSTLVEFAKGTPATQLSTWGSLADTSVVDTAVAVDIASPQVLNYDVTVNIDFDPTVIANYNTANPTNLLQLLPDSCYSIPSKTATIPAGFRVARIPVILYPQKISPTISYGMPFAITSTSQTGVAPIISGNKQNILYAFIGNPIAGSYNNEWKRWANNSYSGTPSFDETAVATFSPNTPTEISVTSPQNGLTYIIDFTNTAGVLSKFTITIDPNSYSNAGLASLVGTPSITVSSDYKTITISFAYLNTSNAPRSIIDVFTK